MGTQGVGGPQPSDAELVRALRQGRTSALAPLYDRYARLVYSIALRILSNSQEAEDVTQEVFLALWQQRYYDPDRGALGSYLAIVARSRSIDRHRSRASSLRFLERWQQHLTPGTPAPLESVVFSEQRDVVQAALQELGEGQRQVLELAYFEGLSQSEIARRLNLPLGTVKTRTRQALLKLRQVLTTRGGLR